jgi:hypothetical protein
MTKRNEDKMNQNTTADMLFLCDAMGAEYPFRDLDRLPMWFGAARANPEKRAAGIATLRAYQRQIPTEADFARVPAEEPKREAAAFEPIVYDSKMMPIGGWVTDGGRARYEGECPCEGGDTFAACHGAD